MNEMAIDNYFAGGDLYFIDTKQKGLKALLFSC